MKVCNNFILTLLGIIPNPNYFYYSNLLIFIQTLKMTSMILSGYFII